MGNVEESVLREVPRFVGAATNTVNEILDAILKILEQIKQNEYARKLMEEIKDGKEPDLRSCDNFTKNDIEAKLKEYGIGYVFFKDTKTGNLVLSTSKSDGNMVKAALDEILTEQRRISRMEYSSFIIMNKDKSVYKFDNMQPEEIKLFQEKAKRYNFVIAEKNGSVYVAEKHLKDAKKAFIDVKQSLNGVSGNSTRSETKYSVEVVNDAIKNGDFKTNPIYIVSASNPDEYIKVTGDSFEHVSNKKTIRKESYKAENFRVMLQMQTYQIGKPVVLPADEFENKTKEQVLENIKNVRKRPFLTEEELQMSKVEKLANHLIRQKTVKDDWKIPDNINELSANQNSVQEFFKSVLNEKGNDGLLEGVKQLNAEEIEFMTDFIKNQYGIMNEEISVDEVFINEDIFNSTISIDKLIDINSGGMDDVGEQGIMEEHEI